MERPPHSLSVTEWSGVADLCSALGDVSSAYLLSNNLFPVSHASQIPVDSLGSESRPRVGSLADCGWGSHSMGPYPVEEQQEGKASWLLCPCPIGQAVMVAPAPFILPATAQRGEGDGPAAEEPKRSEVMKKVGNPPSPSSPLPVHHVLVETSQTVLL